MHLNSIKLTGFKNYASEAFEFSEKMNCIVGLNGMGKTNLLDAIYYLCMCKSRFSGTDRNLLRRTDEEKSDFFRLEGHFLKNEKPQKIVAKVAPPKKEIEKNGSVYPRLSDHIGLLPVVFIVPDDTNLLLEGSESRRLLIDNVLSQMHQEYLINLMSYNRILKQRNAALKAFAEKGTYNASLIQTYDQQLIAPAAIIFSYRKEFESNFSPLLENLYKEISGDAEPVSCHYKSPLLKDDLETILKENKDKDRIMGRTTSGLHKDDLQFSMKGFPLKRFASQGQLKSFVLAVKLAQYEILRKEKQEKPILLLDDIFDKLDDKRVQLLLELLHRDDFGQIFLTDTHEERAESFVREFSEDYKKYTIEHG
ncbi:MAG: DNA replication and repair protein RecF, partial [Saprospiraceae bacterium]|nr:DNA replication and repair protein RecF [Saprospiraceae bacterium]